MNNKVTLLDLEFHFGIGFLSELLDGTGLKLDQLGIQDDAVLIPKVMFYSRYYAIKRNGENTELSMYDIHDLIDANGGAGGQFWNDFYVAFMESMYKDVPVEKGKKKVTATK